MVNKIVNNIFDLQKIHKMRKIKLILLLLGFSGIISTAQTSKSSQKLRRADCFFGIHFDLHASEDITDAGKTLTPEMVDTFITRVRPDFIQIDCKGHPGISSYPTKAGSHMKGFQKDPLKLFREVTAKNNVALFMHYSGVWDGKAVKDHPDWAVVNAKGEVSKEKTSFFSPYLDQILIPQLKELSDYGVDGAWIDGDCWAVEPEYGAAAINRFTSETGITDIPKKVGDKNYPEWMEYNRQLFRDRLKKYIDAIHQYNPAFQITSNWSYSSMMPEPVNTNVDYLSGDVTPQNGVYRSAFEARCLAPQGKPWDLMAWGFSWNGGKMPMSVKSSIQLEQEAAQIMAMGGGVQFYFQQNRDLSLKPWLAKMLSEIAVFCRARQSYVHKAKAIPQIGILYPTASYQRNTTRPFSGSTAMLQGTLNMVLDGQHPAEILMEHHLTGKMKQYPLIIIPECDYMEPSFREELDNYVSDGGNLLIIGIETAKLFEKELGIKSSARLDETPKFIAAAHKLGGIGTSLISVELNPEAQAIASFYNSSDFADKGKIVAASVNKVAKGKVAGIYFNAGSTYLDYKSPVLRDFVSDQIAGLFSEPMVTVTGSHLVHMAVNQINDRILVSLMNIAGEHTNSKATGYDEIPALKNLTVTIHTQRKPSRIVLQPEGVSLKIDYQNGISKVVVPELQIYSILEVIL
jgi:hypothetical protein